MIIQKSSAVKQACFLITIAKVFLDDLPAQAGTFRPVMRLLYMDNQQPAFARGEKL